jgi:hypothetical protein
MEAHRVVMLIDFLFAFLGFVGGLGIGLLISKRDEYRIYCAEWKKQKNAELHTISMN